jgi:hypothetical protein
MIKKVLLTIVVLIVVGVAALAVVIALRPADVHIERSTTIAASAPVVFAEVNDFHKWDAWSPWAKIDPDCKYTYEGEPAGKGAIFLWSGNDKVGEGKMTITESRPDDLIRIKLDFIRPMEASRDVEFAFKAHDEKTNVTWTMTGKNNYVAKAVDLFMNVEKMVGGDFEKGLAQMKAVAEKTGSQ